MSRVSRIEFPDPRLDEQLSKLGDRVLEADIRHQPTFIGQRAGVSEQFLYNYLLPQLLRKFPTQTLGFPYWRALRYSPPSRRRVIGRLGGLDWIRNEELQGVFEYSLEDQSQCADFLEQLMGWSESHRSLDAGMIIVLDLLDDIQQSLLRVMARALHNSKNLQLTLWLHALIATTPIQLLDQFTNIIAIQPSVAEKERLERVSPLKSIELEELRSKVFLYGPCAGTKALQWFPTPLET